MNESWNPEIPLDLQQNFKKEKEQAFTLYLDFVVDATASMYTVFPAVYYAAAHFLECLSKYEVYPQIGLTLIRKKKMVRRQKRFYLRDEIVLLQIFPYF